MRLPWSADDMVDEKDRLAVMETKIFQLAKECDELRETIHELIPKIASLSVYAEKIPAFSERFERIFKAMSEIQIATAVDRTRLYMICGAINVICSAFVAVIVARVMR
jgi:hypothetical protein